MGWEAKEPLNPQNHRVGWCRPIHNSPLSKRWGNYAQLYHAEVWNHSMFIAFSDGQRFFVTHSKHAELSKLKQSPVNKLDGVWETRNVVWTSSWAMNKPGLFGVYWGFMGIIGDYIWLYIHICVYILPSYVGITMGTIIRIPVKQPGFEWKVRVLLYFLSVAQLCF